MLKPEIEFINTIIFQKSLLLTIVVHKVKKNEIIYIGLMARFNYIEGLELEMGIV